jgi:hypothetical protein
MSTIATIDGTVHHIDDDSIVLITGPYPSDPPTRSYVTGPAPAALPVNEDAAALVGRLHPKTPLGNLTRPNNTPVWFKGAAVSLVRPPVPSDIVPGETVGAVLYVAAHHQAVIESVSAALAEVDSHGGNL